MLKVPFPLRIAMNVLTSKRTSRVFTLGNNLQSTNGAGDEFYKQCKVAHFALLQLETLLSSMGILPYELTLLLQLICEEKVCTMVTSHPAKRLLETQEPLGRSAPQPVSRSGVPAPVVQGQRPLWPE
jgi:hypothetical protein